VKLVDTHGRVIDYLRLSVTDRCNLRCVYCMPRQGVLKTTHDNILRYEEMYRIACCAVSLGIRKIRITGGEPLVRNGIVSFLKQLAGISDVEQLVLTTNGVMLYELAEKIRDAGVQRLNVSLDSLDRETFASITRSDKLTTILQGIEKARLCGLHIKLNMVVMRGVNDHEIIDFARLAADSSTTVRFIEYMPVIREAEWQRMLVPSREVLSRIGSCFQLTPLGPADFAGPSSNFRIDGTDGVVGVITALSDHFCSFCNRIRVTSTGQAKGCLFSDASVDLKPALMEQDNIMLARMLKSVVEAKPVGHLISSSGCSYQSFSMASIGG